MGLWGDVLGFYVVANSEQQFKWRRPRFNTTEVSWFGPRRLEGCATTAELQRRRNDSVPQRRSLLQRIDQFY
jgi:hypothetical protein